MGIFSGIDKTWASIAISTWAISFSALSPSLAHAAQFNEEVESSCSTALRSVERTFDEAFKGYHASVLIHKSGVTLFEKSYGLSSSGSAVTHHTRFLLGSVNKSFDAAMALRLREAGLLSLDRKILGDLPETFRRGLSSEWEKITLRNLLNHTSGIKDYLNQDTGEEQNHANEVLATPQSYLTLLDLAKGLWFTPLSALEYSNTNYLILSKIMESVTQQSYPDLFKSEIISTLGLTETGVDDGSVALEGKTEVALPNLTGVGSAYSSASDLMTYLDSLDGDRLLSKSSLEIMFNPDPACGPSPTCNRYAMGFSSRKEPGTPLAHWLTHQGHLSEVSSEIAKVPAYALNLSVVSDRGDYELEADARKTLLTILQSGCASDALQTTEE